MTTEHERPGPVECKGTGEKKLLVLITDEDYEPTGEVKDEKSRPKSANPPKR